MKKTDLVNRLQAFANQREAMNWRGQVVITKFLAWYIGQLSVPHDEKYDHWEIDPYLPELAVEAIEYLRLDQKDETVQFRRKYEEQSGRPIPDLVELGFSTDEIERVLFLQMVARTFGAATGLKWLEEKIVAYGNARSLVIQQEFDLFARRVYRRGLYELIIASRKNGMSGTFGQTELRSFTTGGRIIFTFARKPEKADQLEPSISFVGEDGDQFLWSAGLQSLHTDFRTAMDIIGDVVENWPDDPQDQKFLFHGNHNVKLDVMAAMGL